MSHHWILAGTLAIGVLLWCRARAAERAALAHYPRSTRARLYLPMSSWRDRISASDHALLSAVRLRTNLGAVFLMVIVTGAFLLGMPPHADLSPPPATGGPPLAAADPSPQPLVAAPVETVVAEQSLAPALSPEAVKELRTSTRLYGTAKVKPVYRLYDVEGARITEIDSDSFWALLGVREGDTVIEIHGEPIDDPAALVSLMNIMENDEHVAMAVRGTDGEVRYLEYRARELP